MDKRETGRHRAAAVLVTALLLGVAGVVPGAQGAEAAAKSLILLIGDGMGPQILSIGKIYSEMELNSVLNIERLADKGRTCYASTSSADKLVTDSAASGTAIACGKKTQNGMIGMLPDTTKVDNIFELAVRAGKSVGAVTTTSISHATPACFLAHHPNRSHEWDIAAQVAECDAAVAMGGGSKYFLPPERGGGRRGGDLTETAARAGFEVVYDREAMLASEADRIMGLFAPAHLPYELDRDVETVPSLAEMTAKAVEVLSRNERGFVLMVEGGRIDHAEHENDIVDALGEFMAFDAAVGYALDYQERNSDVTVIVTADHDCGGPAITALKGEYAGYPDIDQYHTLEEETCPVVGWVSGDHTATLVPVFTIGPGEDGFAGIIDNTDIFIHMVEILGLEE